MSIADRSSFPSDRVPSEGNSNRGEWVGWGGGEGEWGPKPVFTTLGKDGKGNSTRTRYSFEVPMFT